MQTYLCVTCGTQYPPSAQLLEQPPAHCPICEDERQFVGHSGQEWISFQDLQHKFRNRIFQEDPGLWGIVSEPKFAIGQRALLVRAGGRNILWDCISLVDDATVARVRELGGVSGIAISHPHYYSSMIEWSRAFGGVPIYLHAADRQWVQRPDPAIQFWDGETHSLGDGLTLIRADAHFAGFQVLHSAAEIGRAHV